MSVKFSLGIDLGTSNSAVAIADLGAPGGQPEIIPISQIAAPNQLGEMAVLPSALYLPHPQEFPADSVRPPWHPPGATTIEVVGQFARDHGAMVPDRLVTSAKSWLSNPQVDPRQPLLPWASTTAERKLSPVECSQRFLEHLKQGFLHAEAAHGRAWNLAEAQVVLTVPASFNEIARNLTLEAAAAAGLDNVVLLEEPQAAFYAWTAQTGSDWRNQVGAGDVVLVCDVGGGTADFSLIAISTEEGNLALERISVGEHLLLGGDNMDLALAYHLRAQLEEEGQTIDDWQFLALIHAARVAKVGLFAHPDLAEAPVTIPSRGSNLFAKNLATRLTRATLNSVVLDGFFAMTAIEEAPQESSATALQEFGLPYASDPVISKHLARFLTRSLQNVRASDALAALVQANPAALQGGHLQPTAVLFNGGVFKAAPDLAVAKGAASYGRSRALGQGLRIKAGTARSYYVGLESSMPAIPGFKPPVKALCVVAQGMEEGTEVVIDDQEFGLVTGKPASFRFFSSEIRSGDLPGQILANAERDLEEVSRIEVNLPVVNGFSAGQVVPVKINPVVTELGNLELWIKHTASNDRWKVEFQVRME
jgi:molecular chaperone DnaK (HSP70)